MDQGTVAEEIEVPSNSKSNNKMGTRVMYLLLRKDLETTLNWPVGALCTQAAHGLWTFCLSRWFLLLSAATACLWAYKDDPEVKEYMADLDHMHKITLAVRF